MRTRKNKDGSRTFIYSGTLEKEIEYCEKEIAKKTEELKIWVPVYEKMKHEVDYRKQRIDDCMSFIELAKAKLEEENPQTN